MDGQCPRGTHPLVPKSLENLMIQFRTCCSLSLFQVHCQVGCWKGRQSRTKRVDQGLQHGGSSRVHLVPPPPTLMHHRLTIGSAALGGVAPAETRFTKFCRRRHVACSSSAGRILSPFSKNSSSISLCPSSRATCAATTSQSLALALALDPVDCTFEPGSLPLESLFEGFELCNEVRGSGGH